MASPLRQPVGQHHDHDDDARRRDEAGEQLAALTDREREVVLAVGQGRSNAEIAAMLHFSVPTVKTHVSAALAKLGLNNHVQIALLVRDAGTRPGEPCSTPRT